MQVLEVLAGAREGLTLAELSFSLVLPKTSLLHLLRSLEASGHVRKMTEGYKLAAASFRLAASIAANRTVQDIASDILQDLRDRTEETVLVGAFTYDKRCAVYIDRRASPQAVRFAPEVGEQRPLYSTGVGKLLLAFSPANFRDAYLKELKLVAHGPRTLTNKSALRENLERIRRDGIAVSVDEMVEGGSAMAAPVVSPDGSIRAALVLAIPTTRFLVKRVALEQLLRKCAAELSSVTVAT
jgi:DNA-binding IclR family transcriptional regulator